MENWSYALKTAPDCEQIRQRLAARVLQGWPRRQPQRDAEEPVRASSSTARTTRAGASVTMVRRPPASPATKDRTEVPRRTLIEALEDLSDLHNT